MQIRLYANEDLEEEYQQAKQGTWRSIGDDPQFLLRFPPLRPRYIVIRLEGDGAPLDPRLYINKGHGFREQDSIALPNEQRHVIIAEIGHFGTICTLRFDPCSFDARFSLDVSAFRSRRRAEKYATEIVSGDPSYTVSRFFDLPRFWLRLPRLTLAQKTTSAAAYAAACYRAASSLEAVPTFQYEHPWLSIIVPVYNAPTRYLDELLASFRSQRCEGVELIFSDDGSSDAGTARWLLAHRNICGVKVALSDHNGGIAVATNKGLELADGEWVTFLDHDDVIAPHGLQVIFKAIQERRGLFFYTDELVVNDKLRTTGIMLKPAFDPVLLTGMNYINHFSIFRRDRLKAIGALRQGYDGSQDYDLLLRYLKDVPEQEVVHIPYPAYLWRRTGSTYSRTFLDRATKNARKALVDRFASDGIAVRVAGAVTETLHRVIFDRVGSLPRVSIIIPSKDAYPLIDRILRDVFERTDYPNFEVIVIDNGSTDSRVLGLYDSYRHRHQNFIACVEPEDFNFSRSVNKGIALATGDHFLILNNDIEVIQSDWLKEMVSCLAYERTGIVGAKLLYPNNRIQHAGVIVGFGGLAGHWYLNKPHDFGGPMNRLHVRNSMSCVTGAVMLISGECARDVGVWDEEHFKVAYNDVDYCLRARREGFRVVWTPFASLYHHESATRGAEVGSTKRRRFEAEKRHLQTIHSTSSFTDPILHPAYSRDRSNPKLQSPAITGKEHAALRSLFLSSAK